MKTLSAALGLGFACVLGLSACTVSGPSEAPRVVDVSRASPVVVNVSFIEFANGYRAPMGAPNVEHLFKTTPAEAVQQLLTRQLVVGGVQDTLRVTIEDASVVRTALPIKESIFGLFSKEPAEEFTGRISLKFEMFDPSAPDIIRGRASVTAARQKSLSNDASPADRDMAYHQMTQELVDDVAAQVGKTVRSTFGRQ